MSTVVAELDASVPVISHWMMSAETTNRGTYRLFTRTALHDDKLAESIAIFLHQMKYTRVTGLAMNQDSVPELRTFLTMELQRRGIQVNLYPFNNFDPESIENAVKAVVHT